MTPQTRRLYRYFEKHPRRILSVRRLYDEIWGGEYVNGKMLRTVHVHKCWLAKHLAETGEGGIETVRGRDGGYRFVPLGGER